MPRDIIAERFSRFFRIPIATIGSDAHLRVLRNFIGTFFAPVCFAARQLSKSEVCIAKPMSAKTRNSCPASPALSIPRSRDVFQDMEALKISRHDNPYLQVTTVALNVFANTIGLALLLRRAATLGVNFETVGRRVGDARIREVDYAFPFRDRQRRHTSRSRVRIVL